jgi:hypothetical protein
MEQKKSEFALENFEGLIDDKMSKNIMADLKRHLPPGGFQKNKPLLVPSASAQINAAKIGVANTKHSVPKPTNDAVLAGAIQSNSSDLMVNMTKRLQQLE